VARAANSHCIFAFQSGELQIGPSPFLVSWLEDAANAPADVSKMYSHCSELSLHNWCKHCASSKNPRGIAVLVFIYVRCKSPVELGADTLMLLWEVAIL
jgi:hypothetical protein